MNICEILGLMLWPIVSLAAGLVGGIIISVVTAAIVFTITLIRTPMHMAKMMYVTATIKECFEPCQSFDPLLRVAVFFLVPIPHILFLVGVTLFCLTAGTVYYINKTTKTVYKCEFASAFRKASSNVKLESTSHLGSYVQGCHEFMENDEMSHPIIFFLKVLCALVPGIPLGAIPFIPFSIAALAITLYRLPISVCKTMKIALFTVALKWDLKICALLTLPVIHILFPFVVVVTALIGSFFYFVFCTTASIVQSKSPFDKWSEFKRGLKRYYEAHQQFVGEGYLGRYDHPTYIPMGWRGERYGLPIQQILQWQWDFLVCCVLVVVTVPICLAGSVLVFVVKVIPGTISWWETLCEQMQSLSMAECLGMWACYLLLFLLTPVGAVLASALLVVAAMAMSVWVPPTTYLKYGYWAGLYAPLDILGMVDRDSFELGGFRLFACLPDGNPFQTEPRLGWGGHSSDDANPKTTTEAYWDRFSNQCIQTTVELLRRRWVTAEQVQTMDPAIIQSVPAVATLTILVDSILDTEAKDTDIRWKIDGTLCQGDNRPPLDNIASLLLPKAMEVKKLLLGQRRRNKSNSGMVEEVNVKTLAAMLCSNTDEMTTELDSFIKAMDTEDARHDSNKDIRSKLTELSLMILRVKPFQDRMTEIFCHDYPDDAKPYYDQIP